jgi:hypothetical protein
MIKKLVTVSLLGQVMAKLLWNTPKLLGKGPRPPQGHQGIKGIILFGAASVFFLEEGTTRQKGFALGRWMKLRVLYLAFHSSSFPLLK